MKKPRTNFFAAGVLGTVLATTAFATAYPSQVLASGASINIGRARAIARNIVPGTIVSEELEKEVGGSGLRYTFDIKGKNGVREVGIDARTGTVLENTADGSSTNSHPSRAMSAPATSGM